MSSRAVFMLQEQLGCRHNDGSLKMTTWSKTLAADGADHPIDVRPLLRRSWLPEYFLNAKVFHLLGEEEGRRLGDPLAGFS
jgi:hypothetical protein